MTQNEREKVEKHFDELHAKATGIPNIPDDIRDALKAAYMAGADYAIDMFAPRWISAEDELPEEDGYYLCVICETSTQVLFYNDGLEEWYEFYFTKEEHLDCEDLTKKVTHWMSLPQPPKKGGEHTKEEIKGNQGEISPNRIIGSNN